MIVLQGKNIENDCQEKRRTLYLIHGENIFDEARKLFFENVELRDKMISVVDGRGEFLYYLKWKKNQVEEYCYVKDFWEYDISDPLMDYELLDRGEVYLFLTLEEYTYHIARIIQRKYPWKKIFFTDRNAKFFLLNRLRYILSPQLRICIMITKSVFQR